MDNFLSLKILDKFQKLFERFGIDYSILRNILKTKLILDSRVAPVIAKENNKSEELSFIKRYLLHLIFGVFLALFIYFIQDEMIRMIYFSAAFFFMTTMYLISDFSFVLLDTKDKNILMTKPIDSRVVSISKALHILIYMFRLNLFLAGPSLIAIVKLNGLVTIPIFVLEILLMDLLIFLATTFIYLLILRFFDGELLRNIINLIQILLTILVTLGYQVVVRMIDFTELQNITYKFKVHNYFNPILWFGAPFEIIFNGGTESYLYVFTVLLVIVPLISFVIYLKISKKMESLLLKLDGQGSERPVKHKIEFFIGKLINKNEITRQAFHFSNAVFRSDRSLKLKIYPSLSVGIFFPVIMIFNMGTRSEYYQVTGYEYLYMYFSLMTIPTVLELTKYSSTWKGSYVYFSSGFNNFKELYRGVLQAITFRMIIPLMFLNGVLYILLFKDRFIVDVIVILLVTLVSIPIISRIVFVEKLPFSQSIDESNQDKHIGKFLASIFILACFIVPHVIFSKINLGIYIFLLIVVTPVSWKFAVPKI